MKLSFINEKNGRSTILGAILMTLLMAMVSCSYSDDEDYLRTHRGTQTQGDIVVGAAAPWAKIAEESLYWQGIEMAVDEINEGGGVLGRKLRIIKEDDEGSISKGRIVAQGFADNPDMVAVIGHYDSYMSLPISIIYEYYGLLMLTATCTATELTHREGFKHIFSIAPTDEAIARELAEFMKSRGYKRLMTYHVNDDYGRDLVNAFETRAAELDCVIVDRLSYDATCDEKYFRRDLEYWKRSFVFDAILLAGRAPLAVSFIKQARRVGITVPIVCGDALDSPLLLQLGGEEAEGTIVATLHHAEELHGETRAFNTAFVKRYGKLPDAWASQGYDAVKLLAYAMQKAGSTVPDKVAKTISSIKNWSGVTGVHSYNGTGEVIGKEVDLEIVRNGKFKPLEH
jgi:branched-chain amino acid transport system substrate-binding protein